MYESYNRNGVMSWVKPELKGRQKEFCMCWDCSRFAPEQEDKGCPIIQEVLALAARHNVVLPMWECPKFRAK